eukprot:TRINITY_DN3278_c0_g1_i3.p1 TRINITY_DN3278_c0_g1~~TRINITY_DN3278_c0_g1_i3.p1  ORF type:complete len:1193 (-),score=232.10 TRINITY_DN3278_c0_g1_i3:231-3809(-)
MAARKLDTAAMQRPLSLRFVAADQEAHYLKTKARELQRTSFQWAFLVGIALILGHIRLQAIGCDNAGNIVAILTGTILCLLGAVLLGTHRFPLPPLLCEVLAVTCITAGLLPCMVLSVTVPHCLSEKPQDTLPLFETEANRETWDLFFVIVLDCLVTSSHLFLPVRWSSLWPIELLVTIGFTFSFLTRSSLEASDGCNLLVLIMLVCFASYGKRIMESNDRSRFMSTIQWEQHRPAFGVDRDLEASSVSIVALSATASVPEEDDAEDDRQDPRSLEQLLHTVFAKHRPDAEGEFSGGSNSGPLLDLMSGDTAGASNAPSMKAQDKEKTDEVTPTLAPVLPTEPAAQPAAAVPAVAPPTYAPHVHTTVLGLATSPQQSNPPRGGATPSVVTVNTMQHVVSVNSANSGPKLPPTFMQKVLGKTIDAVVTVLGRSGEAVVTNMPPPIPQQQDMFSPDGASRRPSLHDENQNSSRNSPKPPPGRNTPTRTLGDKTHAPPPVPERENNRSWSDVILNGIDQLRGINGRPAVDAAVLSPSRGVFGGFEKLKDRRNKTAKDCKVGVQADMESLLVLGCKEQWLINTDELEIMPEELLGAGTFGVVVASKFHGTTVAVKLMRSASDACTAKALPTLATELRILRHVRHPNIVLFHGACIDPASGELGLVLEYINGVPLDELIYPEAGEPPQLKPLFQYHVLLDICCALRYLHTRTPCIVHGDLKGSNTLVEGSLECLRAKLVDFGLSRIVEKSAQPLGGTLRYVAPEVLANPECRPAPRADVFSFGRLAFSVVTSRYPLQSVDIDTIRRAAIEERPLPLQWPLPGQCRLAPQCKVLCERALCVKPLERPNMTAVHKMLLGWSQEDPQAHTKLPWQAGLARVRANLATMNDEREEADREQKQREQAEEERQEQRQRKQEQRQAMYQQQRQRQEEAQRMREEQERQQREQQRQRQEQAGRGAPRASQPATTETGRTPCMNLADLEDWTHEGWSGDEAEAPLLSEGPSLGGHRVGGRTPTIASVHGFRKRTFGGSRPGTGCSQGLAAGDGGSMQHGEMAAMQRTVQEMQQAQQQRAAQMQQAEGAERAERAEREVAQGRGEEKSASQGQDRPWSASDLQKSSDRPPERKPYNIHTEVSAVKDYVEERNEAEVRPFARPGSPGDWFAEAMNALTADQPGADLDTAAAMGHVATMNQLEQMLEAG